MRLKCALLFAMVATTFAQSQMMNPPTPPQLKKVAFFAGNWKGTETMEGMGAKPTSARASMVGKIILDGKYVQSMHIADMGKMGKMQGMHLLSYDPFKKRYTAFWFDSSAPGVMEMSGDFQGNKLVMLSKPTEIPGMSEPANMRATWTKHSERKLEFLLEMKEGEKWTRLIHGNFTK